jgi:hypothetical protein
MEKYLQNNSGDQKCNYMLLLHLTSFPPPTTSTSLNRGPFFIRLLVELHFICGEAASPYASFTL